MCIRDRHPDVLLWAVWALQQYAMETSRENCRQMYGNLLEEIVDYIHEQMCIRDSFLY